MGCDIIASRIGKSKLMEVLSDPQSSPASLSSMNEQRWEVMLGDENQGLQDRPHTYPDLQLYSLSLELNFSEFSCLLTYITE